MSAAVANRLGAVDPVHGQVEDQRLVPVAASTHIYAHTMVSTNATGYAVPAADDAGQAGRAVWFALGEADNTAGVDGELQVLVMTLGVARLETGALTQAAVGQVAHVLDDSTLALSSANSREIGRVLAYSPTRTDVQIGQK